LTTVGDARRIPQFAKWGCIVTALNKKLVDLDRSKLLGFDHSDASALPAAKVGPKELVSNDAAAPSTKIGAKVGLKGTIRRSPLPGDDQAVGVPAALSAKVGIKTVITSVETASGFRSTLDEAPEDRSSISALTFSTADALSIGLDWTHLLGFDQAVRPTAMVGEKDNSPALRAKVGSKDPGRPA